MSRTCFDCKHYDEKLQARCELDREDQRACFHYNLVNYEARDIDIVKFNETKTLGGK